MSQLITCTFKLAIRCIVVLVLLCGAAPLVPGAAAQGGDAARLRVVADFIVVREGRDSGTPLVAQLVQGAEVPVIGSRTPGGWYQVQLRDGRQGWVDGTQDSVQPLDSEGQPVAMDASPAAPTGMLVFQTSSGGAIYTINADGTDLRYLTHGMDPALSPDRQWVAFTRWDVGAGGLYIIRTDGTEERQLLAEPLVKAPAWSPDGAQIAVSYQHGGHVGSWVKTLTMKMPGRDGEPGKTREVDMLMPADPRYKIAVVRVADSYLQEMYSHDASFSPTWSPDGKRIAYASDKGLSLTWDGITSAATQDPNTYGLTLFRFNDRSPAWSPDGQRVAFQYKTSDRSEIFLVNADGSGRVALTHSPAFAKTPVSSVSPAWSPDGTQIAYLSNPDGKWDVWVMNVDGSDQRPMFAPGTLGDVAIDYENVDERVISWQ